MSGVTLDELLEEVGVSPTQLDETCSRKHLQDIALFLESWRIVVPHLGLSKVQVEEVERDGTEEKEKRQKILESWRAKFAHKANYKELVKALLKIGRADQAEQVCHLLVQQHKEGTQNGGMNNGDAEDQRGVKGTRNGGTNSGNAKGSPLSSRNVANEQHRPFVCPCGECTIDSYIAKGCPKLPMCISTNGDRTFPYLDTSNMTEEEKQVLHDGLLKETKSMIRNYGHLVTSTNRSLQKQEVNPKDLAVTLLSLDYFKTYENQQPGFSRAGEEIRCAPSIPDIFLVLVNFWSFYNYEVLEHIIQDYGTPEDKEKLRKYLNDLEKFCQRRIFEVPPHVYGNESNKENWAKFTVKSDDKIKKLCDLRQLQSTIAEILGLPSPTLYLCDITDGCVEVVFLIPQLVAQKVFPLSDAQQNALSANHIMKYSCNLVHLQRYSNSKQKIPATSQPIRQPTDGEDLSSQESNASLEQFPILPELPCSSAGVDALPARSNSLQQTVFGVQQPNPEVQPPPPQAHPHYHHPTLSPSHKEKAPWLLSLRNEAEEEHHDNRFDQPNLSQLDYNVSTSSKNLRMDGSSSESADADVNALLANQTQSPPQQGVQQPNQEKAPQLLSPHVEAEEEPPDDNQFDQPNQSQLDHDATTLKNLRMDGSSSGSESGQLTCLPEATSLFPSTRPTPLTPQSSVGADSPQPSPSVEELSSQPPTHQLPSQPPKKQLPSQTPTHQPSTQPPTDKLSSQFSKYQHPSKPFSYQHPSQPSTNLESAQIQPLVEIKQFEEKYTNLVRSVLVAFQQGSVSVNDIQAFLMALPISRQLQLGNLLQSKAHQLSQASSISKLFLILSETPYWNFLNPSLLSHLVEQFGDGPMKQQKDKYLEELREFRMRTKVDDFMEKWTGASQSDTQELVVELEEEVWRKCTLEQLEQFRLELSRTRSLEDSALPFKVPGINAVFSLPRSIDDHILHLEDLRGFFLAHNVLRVLLNGDCILDLQGAGVDTRVEAAGLQDTTANLGDGVRVQYEEEPVRKDWGEDDGETARGEQVEEVIHKETDLSASTATVSQMSRKKHQYQKQLSSIEHERMEEKILCLLTDRNTSEKPAALPEEDSEGMVLDYRYGGLYSRNDVMMIVSVGTNHPPGVRVAERVRDKARATRAFITYGKLPNNVASLLNHISEETAADLKVVSSNVQKSITTRDINLKLDVPAMQRPKEYYITAIANFLEQCGQPGALIWYMGHSEEGTGDWCFKDGTISFQEIFDLYKAHSPGRLLMIVSDCCYSGNWVHRCAESLDNKLGMRIPPCGHKARERGVLIKVYTSCQDNQKASEPHFSTDGMYVNANFGALWFKRIWLTEHQTTMIANFTKLVCCRDPESSCPAEDAFKNWKWDDAVSDEMRRNLYLVRGKVRGRPAWHYVLLSSGNEDHVQEFKEQVRTGDIDVADWGHIMFSGLGEDPPDNIRNKVYKWTVV